MKKILLVCLSFAAGCAVLAQRPVGDTLTAPAEDYYSSSSFHQCWPVDERGAWNSRPIDLSINHRLLVPYQRDKMRDGNYIGGQQMFTDHPLKVLGIAVCAYMQRPMDTVLRVHYNTYYGTNGGSYIWAHEFHSGLFFPNTRDTTLKNRITDSAILYRVTADGLRKVAAAPWRIEYPHRFIHLPPVRGIAGVNIGVHLYNSAMPWTWVENWDQDPVLPLYEVMFDSAVVVEDSFVVASTAFNNEMTPGLESPPAYPSLTETMWL